MTGRLPTTLYLVTLAATTLTAGCSSPPVKAESESFFQKLEQNINRQQSQKLRPITNRKTAFYQSTISIAPENSRLGNITQEKKLTVHFGGAQYSGFDVDRKQFRLSVVATKAPYSNTNSSEHILGSTLVASGDRVNFIRSKKLKLEYTPPSYGLYYVTLRMDVKYPNSNWVESGSLEFHLNNGNNGRFSLGGHPIAGSTAVITESGKFAVMGSYEIDDLLIRRVRRTDQDCDNGHSEHIEMVGPIGPDSTFAVEKVISQTKPCVLNGKAKNKTIFISSPGGEYEHGFKLGEIFKLNNVKAVITGGQNCASSCAIAFLGAESRQMKFDSTLMFHAPYLKAFTDVFCIRKEYATKLKHYYQQMIGDESGNRLFDRTMSVCSDTEAWTLNKDAAELYGITNSD